jgi:sulfate/thiosulfate transport system permease protein
VTATLEEVPATAVAGTATTRRKRERTGLRLGSASGTTLGVIVIWLSLLVLLPLAAVVGKAFGSGWHGFWSAITDSVTADALKLTIGLSVAAALVNAVMGTVVAWVLVRDKPRGAGVFEMVIDIPFALPTIVAGVVTLALYGSDGLGPNLFGSQLGIFVALLFVTLPFTVRTVQPVLLDLDLDAEQAASSLGASTPTVFRRIVLPQIMPAVASGAALSFARALGEYGSLVLISSNVPHHTLIASSLIYGKIQDGTEAAKVQAAAIATVLLVTSAVVLVLLDLLQRRVARRG